MRIAITGATGFLGKYLVNYLFDCSYKLTVIAIPEENASEYFSDKITIYESNYSHDSLIKIFDQVDVVIHLVAQTMQVNTNPLRVSNFTDVNLQITENILVAAQETGVEQVIQMSSNGVYSSANNLPFKETEIPIPATIYGVSKLFAEKLGEYISYKTDLNVVSLRLARLYGYGERDSVVFTKYMKLALNKEPVEVWGEGKTGIDYLYVRDAVEAIELAVRKKIESGIYNVGSGKMTSVKEIANAICKISHNLDNLIFDKSKQEGGYYIEMDSSKFQEATNWKAKWKLNDAVEEMFKLYQEA